MGDSLSIIFAVIVALVIMFIVPLVDTWELQDNLSYVVTYAAVTDFVDTVRNTGYLSLDNYQSFVSTLSSTGNRFAVSMEHRAFNSAISADMIKNNNKYMSAYLNTYTNTILDTIINGDAEGNHIYKLDKGDYFYVTVKNTNITQASIVNSLVAKDNSNFKIGCAYGGLVWSQRDE
ncbi:MAG: hypothetical protein IKI57_00920 [Clostridia bacterium]|nr:hypothetical protein [Clostridia bacterium]